VDLRASFVDLRDISFFHEVTRRKMKAFIRAGDFTIFNRQNFKFSTKGNMIKRSLVQVLILHFIFSFAGFSQEINPYTCTFKGKTLFGKVRKVTYGEDFKVKAVKSSEDLSVVETEQSPDQCGEWKFVDYGEDFKVRFVEYGEDFSIRYTTGEPKVKTQSSGSFAKEIDPSNCTFQGIPLKGKVKIVTSFPDFKVKVVDNFEDIAVKLVSNFPDDCGEWQFVENFPDFKIQYVENFEDLKIKFVENFPGVK